MARAGTSMTADAIRIEDEVWQEAFETRVPSRPRRSAAAAAAPATTRAARAERPPSSAPAARVRPVPAARVRPAPAQAPPLPPKAFVAAGPDRAAHEPDVSVAIAPERRTIRIQGRGAERNLPWPGERPRRRPPRTLHERAGLRPDRVAMWAMFLGLLLVFVAAVSAHG